MVLKSEDGVVSAHGTPGIITGTSGGAFPLSLKSEKGETAAGGEGGRRKGNQQRKELALEAYRHGGAVEFWWDWRNLTAVPGSHISSVVHTSTPPCPTQAGM
ncbi:hypothetical protein JZ751_027558 [Albula glossodonta]|uniref:Uncharacterized protein n=1 Tax=Albula glossodonta TaxID=121402 RepID=A0A8T2NC07_9TELE|nr:hypothetical protein JZ751_027558 [Albula glossodonta]